MMTTATRNNQTGVSLLILQNIPILLFIAIFIVFGVLSPNFLTGENFENIIKQSSYIGVISVGMTFVLLTAGIDLSVGSIMYLSAVVAGLAIQQFGFSAGVALVICLGVGLVFGAFNAFAITRLKIIPFIVTLSTLAIGRGLSQTLTRSETLHFPPDVIAIGTARFLGIPVVIWIFAGVVIAAHIILTRTVLGRQIYAVGNNIEVAKKSGINTSRVLAAVYIISGLCAALGGFISVAQLGVIQSGFALGYEFNAIAASVLGGTSLFGGSGSILPGTVLGTVLVQMVQAGLVFVRVDLYIQPLIQSGIIFLAVLLDSVREGLLKRLRRRNIRTVA